MSMIRLTCPNCHAVFMLLTSPDDSAVCPHCGTVFIPEEEELYDPEDDE
ncbi:MAG: hypothetical protein QN198_09870 [Armatimonadota bacterium]|nr:hypothetical protein [Armatimonadota bacterium]MDR5703891.1 hypothetical protein [Armatimonadota bacterium]MDR7435729.1 hypothetical protein [Armatimonadota bacterium]